MCGGNAGGEERSSVSSDSGRSAIANQSHGNKAEGSAGPHSADLTRFVIPVRPDPNYDISFKKKMAGFNLHARALNWAGVKLSASANKEVQTEPSLVSLAPVPGPETPVPHP